MNQEELKNRQFQLERLRAEGQPLCGECKDNQEQLEREIEDTTIFDASKLGLDEEEINALNEALKEEQKKAEPVRISRARFLMGIREIAEVYQERLLEAQLAILETQKVLEGERMNMALRSRMEYYLEPDGSFSFRARERGQVGFRPKTKAKREKIEDSKTWLKEFLAKQAKQNEGTSEPIKSD